MKNIIILLVLFAVSACASTYVLSDKSKQYLSSMDKATAEKNVEKLSQLSSGAGGLCLAGSLHTSPGTVAKVQDNKLHFVATYEETTGYSTSGSGAGLTVSRHYTVKKGEYAITLNALKRIRIVDGNSIPACQYDGSGKIVIVYGGDGIDGMINVTEDNLDLLIASLHYLSPNAKLSQGVGF